MFYFVPVPFLIKLVLLTQFSHLVSFKSALIIFAISESITFADDLMTLRGIRSETSNIDLIIQIMFPVLAPRKIDLFIFLIISSTIIFSKFEFNRFVNRLS